MTFETNSMYNEHTKGCIHNASMKNTRRSRAATSSGVKTGEDVAGMVLFWGRRGLIGMISCVSWIFFLPLVTTSDYEIAQVPLSFSSIAG